MPQEKKSALIVSCSLNEDSRSHRLAVRAEQVLQHAGHSATLADLRDHELPFCGTKSSYEAPSAKRFTTLIAEADVILMAAPIYNYDLNAAAKNLVELTGAAWRDKVVGFLCAAGGRGSYMSPISMANSLMFDFRCLIVPRFVHAIGEDFREADRLSEEIDARIEQLCGDAMKLAGALDA
jgi:FMN reductase